MVINNNEIIGKSFQSNAKCIMLDRERFLTWCTIKRHLALNSLRHTQIRYDVFSRWIEDNELNADACEAFILHLRQKSLRNATLNSYIRVINLIDLFYKDQGNDLSLLSKIEYFNKQQKVPTFLSIEEIKSILAVHRDYSKYPYKSFNHNIDLTYRLSIWVLASTGCRFSEMANLTKQDLNLGIDSSYVVFKDTKTYQDRQVPIPQQLSQELEKHISGKNPKDYVFTTSTGAIMKEQVFNPELAKRALIAGITQKHVHAHCFRNSYIREHRKSGTDILTLCTLVGHRDPKTTLGYDRFNFDEILKGARNHPLFLQTMPVIYRINKVKEFLDSCRFEEDKRIDFEITQTNGFLSFSMREI